MRNKAAIHRALRAKYGDAMPVHEDCITRALARESKIARAALDIDETDALMEYIAGLEEQFGEADRLMRTGDNDNAKLGGLKVKVDLLAKLAAAKGVVTERKAATIDGELTGLLQVTIMPFVDPEPDAPAPESSDDETPAEDG